MDPNTDRALELANASAVTDNPGMKTDYPQLRAFLRSLKTTAAQEKFARSCGTSLNYLRKAMSKGSRMDVALVEKIVLHSGFVVPPEELRPDVNWEVFSLEHAARTIQAPARVARKRPAARAPVPLLRASESPA